MNPMQASKGGSFRDHLKLSKREPCLNVRDMLVTVTNMLALHVSDDISLCYTEV